MKQRRFFKLMMAASLTAALLAGALGVWPARSAVPHLAYGFNAAEWDVTRMLDMGFDWIKLFHSSNPTPLPAPMNVLYRFLAKSSDLSNIDAFGDKVYDVAAAFGDVIEAYEIGNEVNINNPDYGWGATPNAAQYKQLLCEAYSRIRQADPTAVVISAGLAPVGRVPGPDGNDGDKQDERRYLAALIDADGGACLDAVGYHPYGFSADYDAEPDEASDDPTRNCDQGFCFRGVEKIYYEVMQPKGLGDKKVWATEFGWITRPPSHCFTDPNWQREWADRSWQIVTDNKQAYNLVGAYQYADAHWPWLAGLFVFNLNFNTAPWYSECDQMRYYGVQGRPAETDLKNMPKSKASLTGQLKTSTDQLAILIGVDEQPVTWTPGVGLGNGGWQPLRYTATVNSGASVVPGLSGATGGTLSPTQEALLQLTVPGFSRTLGTYTGTVTVSWYAAGAGNKPKAINLQMIVVSEVKRVYLPLIQR